MKQNPKHFIPRQINETVSVQLGPVNLAHIPFAPRKDCKNERNGIVKRLIHKHVLPSRKLTYEVKEFVQKKVLPYITPLPPGITDEELRNEWNEDNSYSAKRKEELKRLADTYLATKKYPDSQVLESKMFMKDEFYEEKKHARLIISRSDTFKGIVGPYAHAFDKELFHGKFSHYFVKGKDSAWKVKRMSELQAKFPQYMETDYSSFEGSQCAMIQDAIERQVFKHFFKFYPQIFKFIDATYSHPISLILAIFSRSERYVG